MTHYLLSVYNSMSKTFPQEGSEAFLNLKKAALCRTKKTSLPCFNRVLLKALRKKDMVLFGFSKKKLFGTLPPLLNKPLGFITKLLENNSKIVLSKVLPTCRCRDYAPRLHWYIDIFYWIQYKFQTGLRANCFLHLAINITTKKDSSATRAVESEVPSSDSDSGQFRLSDSDSNSDLQLY